MNAIPISDKISEFDANVLPTIRHQMRAEEVKREEFLRRFPIDCFPGLNIEDYVLHAGNKNSFSYWLEYELEWFGRFSGSPADKRFGIYFGKTVSDPALRYRFNSSRYGNTYEEAYQNIINGIIELLQDGKIQNLAGLIKNRLTPLFKGKLLSTYFPETYPDIYSEDHLNFFIKLFSGNPSILELDAVQKRAALVDFKNSHPIMAGWNLVEFCKFLYYVDHPDNNKEDKTPKSVITPEVPILPPEQHPVLIELPTPSLEDRISKERSQKGGKPDYDKIAKAKKRLGERGEKLVLEMEIKRLKDGGYHELAEKVDQISKKNDRAGYDILSFEFDTRERHIEVKSTVLKPDNLHFYLTDNELQTAKEDDNYFIYVVFEIDTLVPKVWAWRHPFKSKAELELLQSVLYWI